MTEVFELQFKNSIRYGMSYEQFWFDDPQLYYIYEDVYIDKLKEKDLFNWQLGQYIQFSVASCLTKDCKYPDKPIFYAQEEKKKQTVFDMRDKFMSIMQQINKKFD